MTIRSLPALAAACLLALPALAQPLPPDQPDRTLDAATRAEVIDAALSAIDSAYVYPEVARRMVASIRERERAGEYAATSAKMLAQRLTADLQAVSRDKHLRVFYTAAPVPADGGASTSPPDERRERYLRSINYGFEKVERLPGNVGYLGLRSFQGGAEAEEMADAAMTLLASSDALIVDLRRNGGGSPHMVAHLTSYLFEQRTHLNDLYWRERDRTDEFWTKEVRGKRLGASKPVFVLTSGYTFSGAEEFAYNLKALRRATIVGEKTGGGAHPGDFRRLHEHFRMFLPTGRAINPVTKTNWEGTGVEPDVEVPAEKALERAQELAAAAIARSR